MVIAQLKARNGGFIRLDELPEIIRERPLHPCLIRCGMGRFSCPEQDVQHFVDIITRDGADYIRDISLQ